MSFERKNYDRLPGSNNEKYCRIIDLLLIKLYNLSLILTSNFTTAPVAASSLSIRGGPRFPNVDPLYCAVVVVAATIYFFIIPQRCRCPTRVRLMRHRHPVLLATPLLAAPSPIAASRSCTSFSNLLRVQGKRLHIQRRKHYSEETAVRLTDFLSSNNHHHNKNSPTTTASVSCAAHSHRTYPRLPFPVP